MKKTTKTKAKVSARAKTNTNTVHTVSAAFNKASLVVMGAVLTLGMAVGLTANVLANDPAPGVAITSPVDGAVLERGEATGISVVVSQEVVNIGVASLSVSVDGKEICSGGSSDSISCEWKAPNRHDAHTVTAVATDIEGNAYTDAVTVTVACTLRTVNEAAQGEAAKTVTICQPTSPKASS